MHACRLGLVPRHTHHTIPYRIVHLPAWLSVCISVCAQKSMLLVINRQAQSRSLILQFSMLFNLSNAPHNFAIGLALLVPLQVSCEWECACTGSQGQKFCRYLCKMLTNYARWERIFRYTGIIQRAQGSSYLVFLSCTQCHAHFF